MAASLCQDVALLLNLTQLMAQPYQLLALGGGQSFLAGQRLTAVNGGLADPVGDGLRGDAELARELGW
jgi:hypothetical protein